MSGKETIVAYVGLGANLGDRAQTIHRAIHLLQHTPGLKVTAVSSLLDNPSVGGPPNAPPFLNGVAQVQAGIGAHPLLYRLLEIEKKLGRVRRIKSEPRCIDLDLLLYGQYIIHSHDLLVPHPLMHTRRFVLQPLVELAADVVHPGLNLTAAQLLQRLDAH